MASVTASHGFSEGLKKRSRLLTNETYEMTSRMKRCRSTEYGTNTETIEEKDEMKYTQRQFEYFEQLKQAEIARIRTEYEQYLMKREMESHHIKHQLETQVETQERELQKCQSENKLLKRAITIQNQQKEECMAENMVLKQLTTQALR